MTTLADELWKEKIQKEQYRYRLYDEMLEPLINRIFYMKEACHDEQGEHYYTYDVPKTAVHDAQKMYYIQKECAVHLKEKLYERGFFVKTMNKHTTLFISWHPDLLQRVRLQKEEEQQVIATATKVKEGRTNEMAAMKFKEPTTTVLHSVTPRAKKKPVRYIELDGNKSELDNRIALTTFLLQNK